MTTVTTQLAPHARSVIGTDRVTGPGAAGREVKVTTGAVTGAPRTGDPTTVITLAWARGFANLSWATSPTRYALLSVTTCSSGDRDVRGAATHCSRLRPTGREVVTGSPAQCAALELGKVAVATRANTPMAGRVRVHVPTPGPDDAFSLNAACTVTVVVQVPTAASLAPAAGGAGATTAAAPVLEPCKGTPVAGSRATTAPPLDQSYRATVTGRVDPTGAEPGATCTACRTT